MRAPRSVAWLFIVLAITAAALSLLIPVNSSWTKGAFAFHFSLANSIIYAVLHIGAAALFLMGLSAYKATLRRAYRTIVVGIVIVALGVAHVSVLIAFDLLASPWVQSGGVILPFVIAGAATYIGMRSMANQVGVESRWTKYHWVIPFVMLGMVMAAILPHTAIAVPELYFDIPNVIVAFDTMLYLVCALIALKVRKQTGSHYTSAMAWLALGFIGSTVIASITIISALLQGPDHSNYVQDAVVVIGGLIYLKAGLAFAMTKEL